MQSASERNRHRTHLTDLGAEIRELLAAQHLEVAGNEAMVLEFVETSQGHSDESSEIRIGRTPCALGQVRSNRGGAPADLLRQAKQLTLWEPSGQAIDVAGQDASALPDT